MLVKETETKRTRAKETGWHETQFPKADFGFEVLGPPTFTYSPKP